MTRPTPLALLGLLLVAACVGNPSRNRPVRHAGSAAYPEPETLERLRIEQEVREQGTIALVASAADDAEPREPVPVADRLHLDEVMSSIDQQFPLLLAAQEEIAIAEGELLASQGNFDLKLKAGGQYGVDGFYENEQTKIQLEQPTGALGATFFGGYKLGTGDFPVWEGDLKSTKSGELNAGVRLPLLAGRAIDPRRLEVWRARLSREQADPVVARKRLDITLKAAMSYWKWVAAGQKRLVYERLLRLAEDRQLAIQQLAERGAQPPIAVDDNSRLVVERRAIVVAARRAEQQAAIALSLYLRDQEGNPRLPTSEELPTDFPAPLDPEQVLAPDDVEQALRLRPELRALELELEKRDLELEQTENDRLPRLDVGVAASNDYGDPVSDPDDKGPPELDLFFDFDLPLQRRKATGKARVLQAKIRKLERELQFARDSVRAEVQDTTSELVQSWNGIALVREAVRLAGVLETAERGAFDLGDSNLIDVNIREQQTASAAVRLIDVLAVYFQALAEYRAALGVQYEQTLW